MTSIGAWIGGDVAAAYDALAEGYEGAIGEDAWMRGVLHRHHARRFGAGARVLDAGCGTGIDALALARRGVRVTAVDVSGGMLGVLRRRLGAEPGLPVEVRQMDLASLGELPAGSLDGIVSSFAGVGSTDPTGFASAACRLLVPGGGMVLHLLAPRGVGSAGRQGQAADEAGERLVRLAGRTIPHWALPPLAAYRRLFAAGFRLREAYALGCLWPQSWGRRLPAGLATRLGRLEARVGRRRPFLDRGRFAVLDLERRTGSP